MRILQIVHLFPPESMTGTELCTYYLSKELVHRSHEVSIFTSTHETEHPRYHVHREIFDDLDVVRIRNQFEGQTDLLRTFLNFRVEKAFRTYLQELKPDIVHIQHLIGLSASLIHAIVELSIPMVLTVHDYWYFCPRIQLLDYARNLCAGPAGGYKCGWCVAAPSDIPGDIYSEASSEDSEETSRSNSIMESLKNAVVPEVKQIEVLTEEVRALRHEIDKLYWATSYFVGRHDFMHSALDKASLVITPSRHTKKRYVGFGLPEDRVRPLYHGLKTDLFHATEKAASDRLRFAYFGGLMPHKGIEFLLKAFANIPRAKASLLVFGVPSDTEYEAHLHKLAGASDVMWHEYYDNTSMPDILANVDVVVVPSLWEETFNLIVREAFLAKTPVIATRIGALEEAIDDGVDGYLVEPGNVAELREKIGMLMAHPEMVLQLSRGIRPVKDISEQASEIEAIYSEILAGWRRDTKNPSQ